MIKWIKDKLGQFSEPKTVQKNKEPFGSFATRNAFTWGSTSNGIIPNENEDKSLIDTLEDYGKFLIDPHIFSCSQSRKAGMMGMEWEIFSDDKNAELVSFIENCLNKLSLHRIFEEILDAPFFGYQPLEIYWDYDRDNRIVPVNIIAKPAHWFKFDQHNQLKFMARNSYAGEYVPPRKVLLAQHKATYSNPYGTSVLSRCYHHVMFKQGGMELWLQFTEKYGMPLLVGSADSLADNATIAKLWQWLMEFKANGVLSVPSTVKVENINTGNLSASTDVYLKLIDYCNAELSKAILSQTLTTDNTGTTGSYAMSQTHMEVRKDVVIADSKIITEVVNQLIQWIVAINAPEVLNIPYFRMFSDLNIDLQLAQRDKLLFEGNYCKPTKKYLTKRYGFKEDEIIMIESPAAAPEFAEGQNHNFKFDLSKFDELTRNIINQILKLVDAGESFEDIEKSIIELFPDIDTSKIEEYLAKAFVIAQANGMIDGE